MTLYLVVHSGKLKFCKLGLSFETFSLKPRCWAQPAQGNASYLGNERPRRKTLNDLKIIWQAQSNHFRFLALPWKLLVPTHLIRTGHRSVLHKNTARCFDNRMLKTFSIFGRIWKSRFFPKYVGEVEFLCVLNESAHSRTFLVHGRRMHPYPKHVKISNLLVTLQFVFPLT